MKKTFILPVLFILCLSGCNDFQAAGMTTSNCDSESCSSKFSPQKPQTQGQLASGPFQSHQVYQFDRETRRIQITLPLGHHRSLKEVSGQFSQLTTLSYKVFTLEKSWFIEVSGVIPKTTALSLQDHIQLKSVDQFSPSLTIYLDARTVTLSFGSNVNPGAEMEFKVIDSNNKQVAIMQIQTQQLGRANSYVLTAYF